MSKNCRCMQHVNFTLGQNICNEKHAGCLISKIDKNAACKTSYCLLLYCTSSQKCPSVFKIVDWFWGTRLQENGFAQTHKPIASM